MYRRRRVWLGLGVVGLLGAFWGLRDDAPSAPPSGGSPGEALRRDESARLEGAPSNAVPRPSAAEAPVVPPVGARVLPLHVPPPPAVVPVTGRVTYALDGSPVEGATVRVVESIPEAPDRCRSWTAVTAADGHYELEVPSGTVGVARAEGVAARQRAVASCAQSVWPPCAVDLVLEPCQRTLRLRVVDAAGAPVPEAAVRHAVPWEEGDPQPVLQRTDGSGVTEIEGLGLGWSQFVVSAPGFLDRYAAVMVGARDADNLETIALVPERRVRFRVVSAYGEPVVGGALSVRHAAGDQTRGLTNDYGEVVLSVSDRPGILLVDCDVSGVPQLRTTVPVGRDEHLLTLPLTRTLTIAAAEGAGALNVTAEVVLFPQHKSGGLRHLVVRPGAPALLADVPQDARLLLEAVNAAGRACYRELAVSKAPETIRFEAWATDEGRGAPLALHAAGKGSSPRRVEVIVYPPHYRWSRLFRRRLVLTSAPVLLWRPLTWPYVVERRVRDHPVGRSLDVPQGTDTLPVPVPDVRRLRGTVRLPDGDPAPGAYVTLRGEGVRERISATADAHGAFELVWEATEGVSWFVTAFQRGGEDSDEVPVATDAVELALRLRPLGAR